MNIKQIISLLILCLSSTFLNAQSNNTKFIITKGGISFFTPIYIPSQGLTISIASIDPTNTSDIVLHINVPSNQTVNILAATTSSATKTTVGSVINSTTNWAVKDFVHSGVALINTPSKQFYNLSWTNNDITYTNTEEWGMYNTFRSGAKWTMEAIPVDFGSDYSFNGPVGNQLKRSMAQYNNSGNTGDVIYIMIDHALTTPAYDIYFVSNSIWYIQNTNGIVSTATTNFNPMTGLYVNRKAISNTNMVWTGKLRTNTTYTIDIYPGYNYFSWPCRTERNMTNGLSTTDVGWGFLKSGGRANNDAAFADTIFYMESNSWRRAYLIPDGRWWDYMRGGQFAFTFAPTMSFQYYSRTNLFTWTNSYGP